LNEQHNWHSLDYLRSRVAILEAIVCELLARNEHLRRLYLPESTCRSINQVDFSHTQRDPLGSDDQDAGRDRCQETEPQPNSNNIHDPQQRRNMAHSQVTAMEMLTRSVKNLTENISGPAAESVALVMASMDPSEAELSAPAREQAPLKGRPAPLPTK
jgi:hypothetical protein